ncbi:MAG: hypothetical protein JO307_29435 [Bryobacterales bacterium]|nr:hypothetical protein [Bryobacterales bacterium]
MASKRTPASLETNTRGRGTSARKLKRLSFERPTPVPRSAYDVALSAGVIGVTMDAPPDLSTNPEHMLRFAKE